MGDAFAACLVFVAGVSYVYWWITLLRGVE